MSVGRYTMRGRATQGLAFAGNALANLRARVADDWVTTVVHLRGTELTIHGLAGADKIVKRLSGTSQQLKNLTGSSE